MHRYILLYTVVIIMLYYVVVYRLCFDSDLVLTSIYFSFKTVPLFGTSWFDLVDCYFLVPFLFYFMGSSTFRILMSGAVKS
jgi:hypothetical protein